MEFKLTKKDRLIRNAASKEKISPVLHAIHIRKGAIEAVSGFVMVERKIDYDGDEKLLLDIDDIAKHIDSKSLGGVVYSTDGNKVRALGQDTYTLNPQTGTFPNTAQLYPEDDLVFKIALSRTELLNILKCLDESEDLIKFYFYDKEKPVKFVVGDVTGLIMPMITHWE